MIDTEKISETFKKLNSDLYNLLPLPEFDSLHKKLKKIAKEFDIVLFGLYSGGKSSFLNYLLGEETLPVKKAPTTEILWRIRNFDRDMREGTLAGTRYQKISAGNGHVAIIKKDEQHLSDDYPAEKFSDRVYLKNNPELSGYLNEADEIELLYDFADKFSHQIVFWDTPGLGDTTKRKLSSTELIGKIAHSELCIIVGSLEKIKTNSAIKEIKALFEQNKICRFVFILRPDRDDRLEIMDGAKSLTEENIQVLQATSQLLRDDIEGCIENGKKQPGLREILEREIAPNLNIFPLQIRNLIKLKKSKMYLSHKTKDLLGASDFEKYFHSILDEKTAIIIQNKAKLIKEYLEMKHLPTLDQQIDDLCKKWESIKDQKKGHSVRCVA
ncbi:MAG: dynamin family protein [Akkermansia sp.]